MTTAKTSAVSTAGSSHWGARFTSLSLFGLVGGSNRASMICISSCMCGLFGVLRSPLARDRGPASEAFLALGALSEERGVDSAGAALLGGARAGGDPGCRIVKGQGRFTAIWRPDLLPELGRAAAALGHTRWATQGSPLEPANASPLLVPGVLAGCRGVWGVASQTSSAGVVGTHNGDVDAGDLRARFALPPASGTTDSEPIFQLLAGRQDPAEVTAALGALVGRAALAWADLGRPGEVHLARAALSPLAVAVDTDHNVYWASNPRWFREVERHVPVRFMSVVMLREGTYLKIGSANAAGDPTRPAVLARAAFVPTARVSDMDDRVWTGFAPADAERDRAALRHRVAGAPTGAGFGEELAPVA